MRLDPVRALRAAALCLWAGFFDYLWLSGEASRYVGTRTEWVVVFGAVALTLTAGLYLATVPTRGRPALRPSLRELAGTVVLIAPLLAVLVVPAPTLGSLAVARKASSDDAANRALPDADGRAGAPLNILEVVVAGSSPKFVKARGIYTGHEVAFKGFVSKRPRLGREGVPLYDVSRFTAACCAADAVSYTAQVARYDRRQSFAKDTWLAIEGTLGIGKTGKYFVIPRSVKRVAKPDYPWINQDGTDRE